MKSLKHLTAAVAALFVLCCVDGLRAFDNETIQKLVELDENQRNSIESIRVEYDQVDIIGRKHEGNYWERQNNRLRAITHFYKPGSNWSARPRSEFVGNAVNDLFIEENRKMEFFAPESDYPSQKELNPNDYNELSVQGYSGSIAKGSDPERLKKQAIGLYAPNPTTAEFPIPRFAMIEPTLKRLFEIYSPKAIEEKTNEDGDVVVTCKFSEQFPATEEFQAHYYKSWEFVVDFNLSKNGAVVGWSYLMTPKNPDVRKPALSVYRVKSLREWSPNVWLPEAYEHCIYPEGNETFKPGVMSTTIKSVAINAPFLNAERPFKFPKGLIVFENDLDAQTSVYHIWGDDGPEESIEVDDFVNRFGSKRP